MRAVIPRALGELGDSSEEFGRGIKRRELKDRVLGCTTTVAKLVKRYAHEIYELRPRSRS